MRRQWYEEMKREPHRREEIREREAWYLVALRNSPSPPAEPRLRELVGWEAEKN